MNRLVYSRREKWVCRIQKIWVGLIVLFLSPFIFNGWMPIVMYKPIFVFSIAAALILLIPYNWLGVLMARQKISDWLKEFEQTSPGFHSSFIEERFWVRELFKEIIAETNLKYKIDERNDLIWVVHKLKQEVQ